MRVVDLVIDLQEESEMGGRRCGGKNIVRIDPTQNTNKLSSRLPSGALLLLG